MAEYIDKRQVIAAVKRWGQQRLYLPIDFREMLESIPTADVRPVVRGRWEKVGGFVTPGGDPVWQCSECQKGRHVYGIEHGTYGAGVSDGQWVSCPNCGADMRGEDDV